MLNTYQKIIWVISKKVDLFINKTPNKKILITLIIRKTAEENKKKFLNKKIKVFVNTKTKIPGIYEARDDSYNIVLIKSTDRSILGKKLEVDIKQVGVHHMIGEVI
jgi:tRNA A37 methylthiotransferase MiaB